MAFPLTILALVVFIAAFVGALKLAATAGDRKYSAHRQAIAEATPVHHQGRAADFDEYGRTL